MRFKSILFITSFFLFAHANANNNFSIKTVVIDAGHGGKDPGASGPGKTNEKDIALIVALKLGDYITKNFPDVNVIYTRKTDVFLELHERAEIANKAKADLFIAIHINSSPNPEFYGTSTYVLGLHRTEANLEVAKRENSVILLEDDRDKNYEFDPNSPEGHIIMSMKMNAFLDQSIDLASKVENQFENYAKRKSLGVKQAGFYVLYKTTMPSLLAEIGFISNPEEEKFLGSVKGQDQLATALLNAFRNYKTEMEGGLGDKMAAEQKEESTPVKTETKTEGPVVKKDAEPVKAETKTEAPVVKKEVEPVKTESPVVKKEAEPVKTKTAANPDFVMTKSGKNIKKPIEHSSGGGKAVPKSEPVLTKKEEPVVRKEEPKPVVVDKKEEPKPKPVVVEKKEEPKPVAAEPKAETAVVFKIQLFALKTEVNSKEYSKAEKLLSTVSTEALSNGYTRYYGGKANSYAGAKKLLDIAKAGGYPDAYIVGFKDGNRMGIEQMKAFEK